MLRLFFLLAVVLLSSCSISMNKALTRVAQGDMTDREEALFATMCASKYEREDGHTPGTEKFDSTVFKIRIDELERSEDRLLTDINSLLQMITSGDSTNILTSEELARKHWELDSVKAIRRAAKGGTLPCVDRLRTDSIYQQNVAALTACQKNSDIHQQELASLKVKFASKEAENELLKNEKKSAEMELSTAKRQWFGYGAVSAAVLLFLVFLFLKTKRII